MPLENEANSQPGLGVSGDNRASEPRYIPSSSKETAAHYDEAYYADYGNGLGYVRCKAWLDLFGSLADKLAAHVKPRTAFDAGCAKGFLVEALRDRGVEAHGVDLSPYAIAGVREDIKPYCRVRSITEPLGGPYDLVSCIEVMEHVPPAEEHLAFQRLTEASDTIFFSSTPEPDDDPSHYNVRPMRYWLERFAALGFYPDASFDSGEFAYQSFLVRRRKPDESAFLDAYSGLLDMRRKYAKLAELNRLSQDDLGKIEDATGGLDGVPSNQADALLFRIRALEGRIAAMERSAGWRILTAYRSWLRNSVRSRPFLSRLFEPVATRITSWMAGDKQNAPAPEEHTGLADSVIAHAASGGAVLLSCDYPPEAKTTRVLGSLMVEGWAASRTGIDRVEVRIGINPPYRAKFGQSSVAIGAYLPEFEGADHSYFRCEVPVKEVDEGSHYLQVEAFAKDGKTAKAVRQVVIYHRDAYSAWQEINAAKEEEGPLPHGDAPKISVVTPVYRTPLIWLKKCIESVRNQTYSNWELCLVDDASGDPEITKVLEDYARADARIRVRTLDVNQGIAGASNAGIDMATGEYIGFLDHDDTLAPVALAEVAVTLQREDPPDVLYSDEDMVTTEEVRYGPVFKPRFSLELLRSCNYICHFLVVRASLLREMNGIRTGFDGSQDYDLILRLTEKTSKFHHIPRVLYHWRAIPGSTALGLSEKPAASENGRRALQDYLDRNGLKAVASEYMPCRYRVRFQLEEEPEVLIVVPTGGNLPRLRECITSVLEQTKYSRFQLMVTDNSKGTEIADYLKSLDDPRLLWRDFRDEPFNFSRLCNQSVAGVPASFYLFLNDDTKVISPEWLRVMVELGVQPGVGVVGARLLYPDGSIQHAGVLMGVYGLSGHAFRLQDGKEGHYMTLASSTRNCAAVTGACLLTTREVFEAVGGFDEVEFPVNLQDVDYCLKVQTQGRRVIYAPEATLLHYETSTRKEFGASKREIEVMRERWGAWLDDDPFYNPNLTRTGEDYSLRLD